tara:strand:+ start:663 stop:1661 length:999 start_codon:yes stop_codon:yes gene_type:complete
MTSNINGISKRLASTTAVGGIKIGYTNNDTKYAVELDSQRAYVNVPKDTQLTNLTTDATRIDLYGDKITAGGNIVIETNDKKLKLNNVGEIFTDGTDTFIVSTGNITFGYNDGSTTTGLLQLRTGGTALGSIISSTLTSSTSNNKLVRAKGIRDSINGATVAKTRSFSETCTVLFSSSNPEFTAPDMNASSHLYGWTGFTTSSSVTNIISLDTGSTSTTFTAQVAGEFKFIVKLHCTDGAADNSSLIYGYLEVTPSGSSSKQIPLGNCFYQDDGSPVDDVIICGSANVFLDANDAVGIFTEALYRQDTSNTNPPDNSKSFLTIEHYAYTITI